MEYNFYIIPQSITNWFWKLFLIFQEIHFSVVFLFLLAFVLKH